MDPLPLHQFTGTRVEGVVAIREDTLNELLSGGSLAGATVTLDRDNRVVARYGVLHATATLDATLDVGASPRLSMTLASFLVAMALRAALRQPFVEISGRRVTVRLAEVPALHAIRSLWPHVRRVGLSTRRGLLEATVLVAVDEDLHA